MNQAMALFSYPNCKAIEKGSQAKGLRDPNVGVPLSPSFFIEFRWALPGETGVHGLELVPLPLQPRA